MVSKMKKIIRWVSILSAIAGLCLWSSGSARAAGPPIITQVEAQVAILSDGTLDIKYRLSFRETGDPAGCRIDTAEVIDEDDRIEEVTNPH